MYQDYVNDIISYYNTLKDAGELTPKLRNPTPASLRDHAVFMCQNRFRNEDIPTVTSFFEFNWQDNPDKLIRTIKKFAIDRFRPLRNFMTGETQKTEDVNVELLAWLIDFPKRPYNAAYRSAPEPAPDVPVDFAPVDSEIISPVLTGTNDTTALSVEKKAKKRRLLALTPFSSLSRRNRKLVAAATVLMTAGGLSLSGGLAPFFHHTKPTEMVSSGETEETAARLPVAHNRPAAVLYARCVGASPCKACSNCSQCAYCKSGGTCGVCGSKPSSIPSKTDEANNTNRCKGIKKNGDRCKNRTKDKSGYCWVHKDRA